MKIEKSVIESRGQLAMRPEKIVIAVNGMSYTGNLGPSFISDIMKAVSKCIHNDEKLTTIKLVSSTTPALLWMGDTSKVNGTIARKCIEAALCIQWKGVQSRATINLSVDTDDIDSKKEMTVAEALRLYAEGHRLFFTRNRQVHQAVDLL